MCVSSTYVTTYPKYHVVSVETWEDATKFARTLTQTDVQAVTIKKVGELWNISWQTQHQSYLPNTTWQWQDTKTMSGTGLYA
jgi:hypothetical protein